MRDEDPGQAEQQGRILVAARVQPGQRHQHLAPADVGIADQVEGGIGRDEAVLAERAEQMRAGLADHAVDLGGPGRARRCGRGRRGRVAHADAVHQLGDRGADRGPVRRLGVACLGQRRAQAGEAVGVLQRRQAGAAEQRAQRRIAERGPVELSEMRIAAAIGLQYWVANVVKRWAVLFDGQRPAHPPGDLVKAHESLSQGTG